MNESESNYCQGRNIRPLVAALGRGEERSINLISPFSGKCVSQVCGTRGEPENIQWGRRDPGIMGTL